MLLHYISQIEMYQKKIGVGAWRIRTGYKIRDLVKFSVVKRNEICARYTNNKGSLFALN